MLKFVWIEDLYGRRLAVNPDQVAYLRANKGHQESTSIVFGAFGGGMHEVLAPDDLDTVAKALEARPAPQALPVGMQDARPGEARRVPPSKASKPRA